LFRHAKADVLVLGLLLQLPHLSCEVLQVNVHLICKKISSREDEASKGDCIIALNEVWEAYRVIEPSESSLRCAELSGPALACIVAGNHVFRK
jgi:hypothetical protein